MQTDYGVLFGRLYRFDRSGPGPPWPLLVWTEATATWDPIGIVGAAGATGATGAAGAAGPTGSSLVVTPNRYNFVSDTAADVGQPPDFVTTARGDIISVGGR